MDPLRPFTTLIRSLGATTKVEPGKPAPAGSSDSAVQGAPPAPAVRGAVDPLQLRLAALKQWDAGRARHLFVEHVLSTGLGEGLDRDPKFTELVQRVSTHLGNEPALNARLDEVLQQLAAGRAVP